MWQSIRRGPLARVCFALAGPSSELDTISDPWPQPSIPSPLPKKRRLVVVGVAQRRSFLRCACAPVSLIPKAPDRPNRGPPSGLPCLHCASPLKGPKGGVGGQAMGIMNVVSAWCVSRLKMMLSACPV